MNQSKTFCSKPGIHIMASHRFLCHCYAMSSDKNGSMKATPSMAKLETGMCISEASLSPDPSPLPLWSKEMATLGQQAEPAGNICGYRLFRDLRRRDFFLLLPDVG